MSHDKTTLEILDGIWNPFIDSILESDEYDENSTDDSQQWFKDVCEW